jgi:hypothetical protein
VTIAMLNNLNSGLDRSSGLDNCAMQSAACHSSLNCALARSYLPPRISRDSTLTSTPPPHTSESLQLRMAPVIFTYCGRKPRKPVVMTSGFLTRRPFWILSMQSTDTLSRTDSRLTTQFQLTTICRTTW